MAEAGWTQRLKPGRQCDRSGCPKLHPGIGLRHRSKSRVQESVTVAMVMHTLTLRLLALTQQLSKVPCGRNRGIKFLDIRKGRVMLLRIIGSVDVLRVVRTELMLPRGHALTLCCRVFL